MIHSPHFTHIEADTPEQTQAREAAANAEWRKRLLMSHTPPSPIIKLNDLAIHIGPEPRIAQTGLPPKVGGEQEPSPVNQEPIWRYVHGTPDFRRPEPEPQPIVLPPRNENTKEIIWPFIPEIPARPPKRPPPPKPEPLPTREEGGKQENLVQNVVSVLNKTPLPILNRTPIVTSPGVRIEPQPIIRPIENPPRSEPGSIPPWLRIEPLPIVEPPVYIIPSNVNPPTPKPTPEPNPPGLRTEPLPTMLTPVFSASSVSPSRSPMGPPPMLPMTMPFGGGKEIGGMAADMIYL